MKIGAHVSAAGGVWNAPVNATELTLDTFQIFSRPPQGGKAPTLGPEQVEKFKIAMTEGGFSDFVIHAPYFTNLGSTEKRIYQGTISVLRQELERGTLLGASYLMFHPGSFKDVERSEGVTQVADGIADVLKDYEGTTKLLVENSAGAGAICGADVEELGEILERNKKYLGKTLGGICFDTQHAFASGYDVRTAEAVKETFTKFDKAIGLEYLRVLHTNDSKIELSGRKDRHEHISDGKIGGEGFAAIAAFFKTKKINIPWILETKHDTVMDDIIALRGIQKKYSL
jgi:deoxyribonuclease-4